MDNWIVKTKNLKKYYQLGKNTVKALDGVDFAAAEREFVAIIGKSGSGKSTLLHMLGGLDEPTSGEVYVDGRRLAGMSREQLAVFRRRKVGFVFQSYNLVPDLNVYENIVLPIELDGRRIDRARSCPFWHWRKSGRPCPAPCPGDSSSGWPLPGPSPASPPSFWQTSQQATWTRPPATT